MALFIPSLPALSNVRLVLHKQRFFSYPCGHLALRTTPQATQTVNSTESTSKRDRSSHGVGGVLGLPLYLAVKSVREFQKQKEKQPIDHKQEQEYEFDDDATAEKLMTNLDKNEKEGDIEEIGLGRVAGALRLVADGLEVASSRITKMWNRMKQKEKVTDKELEGAKKAVKWAMGEKLELERRLRSRDETALSSAKRSARDTFAALCKTQIKLACTYQQVKELEHENTSLLKELQKVKDDRFLLFALMALLILYIAGDIFGITLITPYNITSEASSM